jgi:hypothetical protein
MTPEGPMASVDREAMKRSARGWPENPFAKIVFVILLGASLCPVLLVRFPAMADYPNHLARMFILSRSGGADESQFYQVVWALYPNLAMDLLVPQIARVIGVEDATRVFLLLSQILIVTGAIAIEWAVKGRVQISGFAALLFLYCLPFAWGFLNFEFALGVAFWGIAAALLLQERPWPIRLAVNALFVAALFVGHFFALGVYGATIGLYELWRGWERRTAYSEIALRLAVLAAPAAVLLGVMALSGGSIGGAGTSWFFAFKPLWLFHFINGYSLPVSAASVLVLVGLGYVAIKRGVLKLVPAAVWIAAGFAILYVAIPSRLFDTSYADLRIIAAAAFILPAFCVLSLPSRRWMYLAVSCAAAVTLANLAVVLFVWISYRADYAALLESFQKIDKGSFVLVSHSGDGDDPPLGNLLEYPIHNAPTLAVHYADAFVPSLFAAAGKQPIIVRPAYKRLEEATYGIVPVAVLRAIAENKMPDAPEFIRSWRHDFDYLYVVGKRAPNPMPGNLSAIYSASRFVLYKIRK